MQFACSKELFQLRKTVTNITQNNNKKLRTYVLFDVLQQEGRRTQIVHRDREESLDFLLVEIHRNHSICPWNINYDITVFILI